MDSFAFIIHPIDPKRDVSRKFPFLGRVLNERQIDFFSTFFPPIYLSQVEGVVSQATGKEIKGWLVACPLTPRRMLSLNARFVYRKIIQTGRMAERLGARIVGLGAYTSVVGDAGLTVAEALDAPVTTGDSYTVAVAVQALERAAELLETPLREASAAVVGATGAIGRACAEMLADRVAELYLIGRRRRSLDALQERIQGGGGRARLHTGTDNQALREARLILSATSALGAAIEPAHVRPGTVICDVAQPRDVSAKVAAARQDVLVIDGGLVDVPGPVDFHFDFGLPPGKTYACMAETMALALEGRFEDYTLGKEINRRKVDEITRIASSHGFQLSGLRSFGKAVSEEQIEGIRRQARAARRRALRQTPEVAYG